MEILVVVVHVLVSLALIGLVLIQQGKGADMGASFGGGASQTLFGAAGSANLLTRTTKWLAVVFFSTSLTLAWLARKEVDGQNTALAPEAPATEQVAGDVPAAPAAPAPSSSDVPAGPAPAGN